MATARLGRWFLLPPRGGRSDAAREKCVESGERLFPAHKPFCTVCVSRRRNATFSRKKSPLNPRLFCVFLLIIERFCVILILYGYALSCRRRLFAAPCGLPPLIAACRHLLRPAAAYCGLPPLIAACRRLLRPVAAYCGLSLLIAACRRLLRPAAIPRDLLPYPGDFSSPHADYLTEPRLARRPAFSDRKDP